MWKDRIIFMGIIVFAVVFILVGHYMYSGFSSTADDDIEMYKARVLTIDSVEDVENEYLEGYMNRIITFSAKLTNGPDKGLIIKGTQNIDTMFAMQEKEISEGDNILAGYLSAHETESGLNEWIFASYNRLDALMYMCIGFLVLVVIIGGMKGVTTILSLVFTVSAIFLVYVPSILAGANVYLSTIIIGFAIIILTLLLINGANIKTYCAIFGNFCGVLVAALLALLMNSLM
jgi:uncharacterized membrane protein